jgi:hypothetical protein
MIFAHHNEPYGTVKFEVDSVQPVSELVSPDATGYMRVRADNGWLRISGIVTEGGVTNRLFQYTSTRSLVGERYTIEVPPRSWDEGHHTDVAM